MEVVLNNYSHLIKKEASVKNIRMLSVKLAKEAVFGLDVMARCTPGGTRDLPALPSTEMYELKKLVLKQVVLEVSPIV